MDKERVKYGIIGEVILKILGNNSQNKPKKDNILTNYLKNNTKKQIFKDIWFVISILGWFYFMFWVMNNIEKIVVPKVIDPQTGVSVEGNCDWIKERYTELQNVRRGYANIDPSMWENLSLNRTPKNIIKFRIEPTTYNNTLQTCPTTTTLTCPPTPDCTCNCPICTKCPTCKFEYTQTQIDYWLNDCQIREGSPCYQSGSADTCDKLREYFNVPGRPKFKTRPSATFYTTLKQEEADTYCFKNLGGYFILNRSSYTFNNSLGVNITRKMWGWNDENCLSSSLRINSL